MSNAGKTSEQLMKEKRAKAREKRYKSAQEENEKLYNNVKNKNI